MSFLDAVNLHTAGLDVLLGCCKLTHGGVGCPFWMPSSAVVLVLRAFRPSGLTLGADVPRGDAWIFTSHLDSLASLSQFGALGKADRIWI